MYSIDGDMFAVRKVNPLKRRAFDERCDGLIGQVVHLEDAEKFRRRNLPVMAVLGRATYSY